MIDASNFHFLTTQSNTLQFEHQQNLTTNLTHIHTRDIINLLCIRNIQKQQSYQCSYVHLYVFNIAILYPLMAINLITNIHEDETHTDNVIKQDQSLLL